jgi:hypothetical protein
LTAIRLAEAQLAVPSGEALQAFLPSHVTRFSPSIAHKFRREPNIERELCQRSRVYPFAGVFDIPV